MRFTKKILVALLVLALTLVPMTGMAAQRDEITVTIDGVPVVFEGQGPTIIENRTLVPVRGVFEVLGFYPEWDSDARTATLTRHDYVVVLTIGSEVFTTNGVEHTLDVPAMLIGGRTLLPLRAVLTSVGYDDMDWVAATRTVVIRTGTTPPQAAQALVGTWYWLGSPFYIFNANGSGMMGTSEINWTAANGVLGVCVTPDLCRGDCIAPSEWYYTIDGNRLVLVSRITAGIYFEYTRGAQQPTTTPAPTLAPTPTPTPTPTATPTPSGETTRQREAVTRANDYLRIMAFSRSGLISQLEFEGFSNADAIHGVDNIDVNWNEQATRMAQEYLNILSFSREGLIGQLVFEGFTQSQATHGADGIRADWYAQAVRSAQTYQDLFSFSRSELINQLVFDGFTQSQAAHAADEMGL